MKKLTFMKNKFIYILLFVLFISCERPPITPISQTYIGSIAFSGSSLYPCCFLQTVSDSYKLTLNHNLIGNNMIVDGIEYFADDIVKITGIVKPSYEGSISDFDLEIETIKKWTTGQNIQRFLGEYNLKGIWKVSMPFQDELTWESNVIITTGTESDLLIQGIGFVYSAFKAFVLDDDFFIPGQLGDTVWYYAESLIGQGKIKNDSLFINYNNGGGFGKLKCEGKGKKVD